MRRNRVAWGIGIAAAGVLVLAVLLHPTGESPASRSGSNVEGESTSSGSRRDGGGGLNGSGGDPARVGDGGSAGTRPGRPVAAGGERRQPLAPDVNERRDAEIARLQGRVLDEKLDPMLRVRDLKQLQLQARMNPEILTPDVVGSVLRLIESSRNPAVRGHAAAGLQGAATPEFKRAMIRLLRADDAPGVRQSAANALAPLNGDAEVRQAFSTALEAEPDVHVRDEIRRSQAYVAPLEVLRRIGAGAAEKKD